MMPDVTPKLISLVEKIKAHHAGVEAEAYRLRTPELMSAFDQRQANSWCLSVVSDSLIRVRLIIEQNFNFIETLGVVAVSRYLFELSVWLNLFKKDERYGLVYFGQLIETQLKYYKDHLAQVHREIEMLQLFESKDYEAQIAELEISTTQANLGQRITSAAEKVDAEAARKFSIYAEQAKFNGYGFQAFLVKNKAIPPIETSISELETQKNEFDTNILPDIEDLICVNGKKIRWEWKRMAETVGLLTEYEYIYTFSSKLLHATPVSITTNHKNLEPEEMLIFLRYIDVKITDMLYLSHEYPRDSTNSSS